MAPSSTTTRGPSIAVKVREICDRYSLPYTTGPLHQQVGSAWAKVFRLALP